MKYRVMKLHKEESIQTAAVDTGYEEIIDAENSAEAFTLYRDGDYDERKFWDLCSIDENNQENFSHGENEE